MAVRHLGRADPPFAAIVESSHDGIVVTEPGPLDGSGPRVVYVNRSFQVQTGWTPDEAVGQGLWQLHAGAPEAHERLRDALAQHLGRPLPERSMGMTDDFEVAIEEGATLVRVGRAIFGERHRPAAPGGETP